MIATEKTEKSPFFGTSKFHVGNTQPDFGFLTTANNKAYKTNSVLTVVSFQGLSLVLQSHVTIM